jgi:hypothetical protein
MQHRITTFERPDNAILDPIMLAIAVFLRQGLLFGTIDEILSRAKGIQGDKLRLEPQMMHTSRYFYTLRSQRLIMMISRLHHLGTYNMPSTRSDFEEACQVTLEDTQHGGALHRMQII